MKGEGRGGGGGQGWGWGRGVGVAEMGPISIISIISIISMSPQTIEIIEIIEIGPISTISIMSSCEIELSGPQTILKCTIELPGGLVRAKPPNGQDFNVQLTVIEMN